MESHLLSQTNLVHLHKLLDPVEALLLPLEIRFELVSLRKLVGHVVFHVGALLLGILHFIVNTRLKRLHLLEVVLDLLLLLNEPGRRSLSVLHLVLLELEVTSHVFNLLLSGQLVLPRHSLLHVLKETGNILLTVLDLLFVLCLLVVELESKLIDLLFLLVQDLVFLLLALIAAFAILLQIIVNFLDVLMVLVDHFTHLKKVLVHLLELSVVLLDPVLEALSGFGKWQVHLIGLQLQVFLSLHELRSLILEMLCSLLESILPKFRLSLYQSCVDFF